MRDILLKKSQVMAAIESEEPMSLLISMDLEETYCTIIRDVEIIIDPEHGGPYFECPIIERFAIPIVRKSDIHGECEVEEILEYFMAYLNITHRYYHFVLEETT